MKVWKIKFASYKEQDDILKAVESGAKTIETRPYTPHEEKDYSKIKNGDKLVFVSIDTGKEVETTAKGTKVYQSVSKMLDNEDFEKIFPGVGSRENLESIFEELKQKWGQEYKNNLEKHGIVAIYI